MAFNQTNGHKRRLDYPENGRTKRPLDDQDFHRKRRRNSSEHKSQELSKKQRRDRAGHNNFLDSDHSIDIKYPEWHDKDGHFNYRLGESLGDQLDSEKPERRRYKLIDKLGQGTFGLVLLAWDRIENCYVAIKIVRAIKKYTENALTEIEILTKIQRSGLEELEESLEQISFSSENSTKKNASKTSKKLTKLANIPKHSCITLESWFQYKEHICMVFQKYGLSLYDYLKQNHFKGLEYSMCKDIAFNLFASLYYLHEGLELIHTDLKPENILFVDDGLGTHFCGNKSPDVRSQPPLRSSEIKIIDLGSATFEYDHHSTVISTRHYRAPEVLLQVGWSYPSDVWSVGCILLELYTGKTYFQTHQNLEHMAMMEALLGPFPSSWLLSHKYTKNNTISEYFEPTRDSNSLCLTWYHEASSESKKRVRALKSLKHLISEEHDDLLDLISKTLIYDPKNRITASEALDHRFFDSIREKYRDPVESRSLKRSYSESSSQKEKQHELHSEQISSFMSRSRANSLSLSGSKIGRDSHERTELKEKIQKLGDSDEITHLNKNRRSSVNDDERVIVPSTVVNDTRGNDQIISSEDFNLLSENKNQV